MKVKTITYKRINNLGNYSSEHLEMFAELDENENIQDATKQLITEVETALDLKVVENLPFPVKNDDEF